MADPSKNINAIVPTSGNKKEQPVNEKIEEIILKLLNINPEDELTYREYLGHLKEVMMASRMSKSKYTTEETELITNEYKRVKSKKPEERFKAKKITAESFRRGSAVGVNFMKNISPGIAKPTLALSPALESTGNIANEISQIISNLDEIIGFLSQQNKDEKKKQEQERKKKEDEKRKRKQKALESGAGKIFKLAQKVFAPVKSLLSRIIDFITAVFFGRALIKLIDWFSDDKNKKKVDAIFRFLGDNWPKLLSLYLLFGTSLGKFSRGLVALLFRGGAQLAKAAASLLAKAGIGKAGKFAKFLGGRNGKLLVGALEVGTIAAGAVGLSKGIEDFKGIDGDQKPEASKTQKFSGGGLAHLKNLFGFTGGSFVNAPGIVSGQKGIDKVPAMLTDGEFVMSRGAVEKYGVDTLEQMNAAGGGTNRPKIMSGMSYADGGGLIGGNSLDQNKLASIARGITVQIEGGGPSGSGVIVNNQNGNYTVLTAGHVVSGTNPGEEIDILTHDGKRHHVKPSPHRIKMFKDLDMATLKFSSREKYDVATPADLKNINNTSDAFVGGFPTSNEENLMRLVKGKMLSSLEKPTTGGYSMRYDMPTLPGMSGGPLLNAMGQLIGIHGRGYKNSIEGTTGSGAIPISTYLTLGGTFGSSSKNNSPNVSVSPLSQLFLQKEDIKVGEIEGVGSGGYQQIKGLSINNQTSSYDVMDIAKPKNISGRYSISPPNKSNVKVVYTNAGGKSSTKALVPNSGTPKLPSFSVSHPAGHSRTAKVLGIR